VSLAGGVECLLGEAVSGETLLGSCRYDDCPEFVEWLEGERKRLVLECVEALVDAAERLERGGDIAGALHAALGALRISPFEESHHRRVMRLHYLNGD